MDSNLVLLDADFCNLILKKPDNIPFFKDIFKILNKKPAVHTYILKHELLNNIHIQHLVKEGFIKIIEYDYSQGCREFLQPFFFLFLYAILCISVIYYNSNA